MSLKRRPGLSFELLEERRVPAATIFASGGSLTILGDNAGNDIEVVQDAVDATKYDVTINGVPAKDDLVVTKSMTISSGSGADTVTVTFNLDATLSSLAISTGGGDDEIAVFSTAAGTTTLTLGTGTGTLSANAGAGTDEINLQDAGIAGTFAVAGNVQLNGGTGFDDADVGDVSDGAFVTISGNLTLIQVNDDVEVENTTVGGALAVANAADTTLANTLVVDATSSVGSFAYSGGTGTDDVGLSALVGGDANISTSDGDDTVSISSTAVIGSVSGGDLTVVTGEGSDSVFVAGDVTDVLGVGGNATIDLGAGDNSLATTTDAGIDEDLMIFAGAGADTVALSGNVGEDVTATLGNGDNSFALSSTVAGTDIDGDLSVTTGSGSDTIGLSAAFFGSGVHGDTTLNTGGGSDLVTLFVCLDENFTFDLGAGNDTMTAALTLIGVGPGLSAFTGALGTGADVVDFGAGGDGNAISSDTVTLDMGFVSPGPGDNMVDTVTGLTAASTVTPTYLNCDRIADGSPVDDLVDGAPCPP